ncbi:peptidylprolyl isomerase [Tsuneonella sp. CC-YZS046]|uniref:peptidylprolyl isomerase n=1 Tax=Tsuneonella sp. CC-YZS046 TaxID=3042152 RepID=UPI002D76D710|nr:peptidylprolyl isomerase [Tsuneonella sp. CC-YZS046]WRO67899.1 peptidylprolyl isomerase [Tsuneonella sp. CC-YZS046]
MTHRFAFLAAPLFLLSAAVAAQDQPTASPEPAPSVPQTVDVVIQTELGNIRLALESERALVTTANFLRYTDQKRFDGTVFYRAMRLAWGDQPNGLIQGGTQMNPKRILKPIAHEATSQTGVLHKAGTISMARYDPGSATGDFSILLSDMPGLDADPASANPDLAAGFAAFGHVVEGMDVVQAIWNAPVDPEKGEGALKGQMIQQPVKIISVRRAPKQ